MVAVGKEDTQVGPEGQIVGGTAVADRGWGRRGGIGLAVHGCGVSLEGDENVWELDRGKDPTTSRARTQ